MIVLCVVMFVSVIMAMVVVMAMRMLMTLRMLLFVMVQTLTRSGAARILAEDQRLDRHRHGI